MMKPEPRERVSERGPGSTGGRRGMKRRKNSRSSSSSTPGICGSALRWTACLVLMFTTAGPWCSTSCVKSGSSRACAPTWPPATSNNSATTPFTPLMQYLPSPTGWIGRRLYCAEPLVRLAVVYGVRDALDTGGGCLTNHCYEVVGHLASIDIRRAQVREAESDRLVLSR